MEKISTNNKNPRLINKGKHVGGSIGTKKRQYKEPGFTQEVNLIKSIMNNRGSVYDYT